MTYQSFMESNKRNDSVKERNLRVNMKIKITFLLFYFKAQ